MNQIRHLVWLDVKQATVDVLPPDRTEERSRRIKPRPAPDANKVWTLNDLLQFPTPSMEPPSSATPLRLQLNLAIGGTVAMAAQQGTLYLSHWVPRIPPNQTDVESAWRLGWVGNLALFLASWRAANP